MHASMQAYMGRKGVEEGSGERGAGERSESDTGRESQGRNREEQDEAGIKGMKVSEDRGSQG